jgi:3-hydroxyisobutyrate dehydrogenase-like beta-hydroxyacid dehydrogenase
MYKKCYDYGIAYIDSPVSGGPEVALKGGLSLMVGAESDVFVKYKRLLKEIGNKIYYMGLPGKGQAAKLVNQIMVGISQIATCEALIFAKDFGLDLNNLYDAISNSAGDSLIFRRSAYQMIEEKFSDDFQTYLIVKDLKNILKAYKKNNECELMLTNIATNILAMNSESNYKKKDAASVIINYKAICDKIND